MLQNILRLSKEYQNTLPVHLPPQLPSGKAIASWIDHTLLKPEALPDQVVKLCHEAHQFGFASVCINPVFVPLAVSTLSHSSVPVCTVIGFPLGANSTKTKLDEALWSLDQGAQELDMVIPIGLLKSAQYQQVFEDIHSLSSAAHSHSALLKVIIENAYLNTQEKIIACLLCKEAGADFVKTSTGFASSGAAVDDVTLMRRVVGPVEEMGVKAAGGIRTYKDAKAMILAGANRIGASASLQILAEAQEDR